jgi:hypothetical protein
LVLQASAQPPQLFTSVVVLTSQPLLDLPSQSAVPVAHLETAQVEFVQTSDAVVELHTWPQEPQLLRSFVRLISQPFAAFWSQSWKPVEQEATEQVDAAHDSTALAVLHGVVQAPQCLGSVARLTHAAFAPPPGGHSVGVAAWLHDSPQLVPSHVETPFVGMGHTLHEAPHELVELLSRHVGAAVPTTQLWVPAGQTQLPPSQTVPPAHACPHVPQFIASFERS